MKSIDPSNSSDSSSSQYRKTKKLSLGKYCRAISLGYRCSTYWQLNYHFGEQEAYLFDHLVTTFSGLVRAFETDFKDWCRRENLKTTIYPGGRYTVHDTAAEVFFHHDFKEIEYAELSKHSKLLDKLYPEVASKYEYKIKKLRNILASNEPLLFVRLGPDLTLPDEKRGGYLTMEQANTLPSLIRQRNPSRKFCVLYINAIDPNTTQHSLDPAVRHAIMSERYTGKSRDAWKGDPDKWFQAFASAGLEIY